MKTDGVVWTEGVWPDGTIEGTIDGAGVLSAVAIDRFEKISAPSAPCSLGGTEREKLK